MKLLRQALSQMMKRSLSSTQGYSFETLAVSQPSDFVAHVQLNRVDRRNSVNKQMLDDLRNCFTTLNDDGDVRAVVLSGNGPSFCSGIDLEYLMSVGNVTMDDQLDVSRKAKAIEPTIRLFQQALSSINDKCTKPVIAAIHNYCIGAGTALIPFCDVRYCTKDAVFQIKEVQLGLAADVGNLQTLGKMVGNDSLLRELVFTGRPFGADESLSLGLVSRVFDDKEEMIKSATELATEIGQWSPVAVQGSKLHLNYARDHTVQESLDFVRVWNMFSLQSKDVFDSAAAAMSKNKEKPQFSKL